MAWNAAKLLGKAAYLVACCLGAVIEYFWNTCTPERKKNYERLSTYVKNAYWVIPSGDGKYFTPPKNRELAVPMNAIRATLERYVGGNPHAYDDFLSYAATTSFPAGLSDLVGGKGDAIGDISLIGPIHQLDANADFRGVPIESTKDLTVPAHQRYNGATSKLAKALGDLQEKLGVSEKRQLSPKQIDFLGNNTLGMIWQYQKALNPVDSEYFDPTLGLKSLYMRDSLYSNTTTNRLFDLKNESELLANGDPNNTDKAADAYFDSAMTGFYTRYNALAREEKDDTDAARRLRDLVLTEQEEYLRARENDEFTTTQRMVYDVCRAAGDTSEKLPGARPTVVKDGDGTVHNLTAAQYYDYQGNFNSLYWNLVKDALPGADTDAEREVVLKGAVDAAGIMAKNNVLVKLGAATTSDYRKYEELQLYSVPVSTYLVAKAKTSDIEGLKDKRTKETITNSKSALVAKAVLEMNLDLPETNVRKLMEALNVDKTVRDWKPSKLERELKRFRKDAGVEQPDGY